MSHTNQIQQSQIKRVPLPPNLRRNTTHDKPSLPLQKQPLPAQKNFTKRKLLTETERKFLLCLMQAVPVGIAIVCKVGLWGVVENIQNSLSGWNKISQKHLDFVLYDAPTNEVKLVIELDDPSHLKKKAQQRDSIKDDILNDAGIPILRVPASQTYDVNYLRNRVLSAMLQ